MNEEFTNTSVLESEEIKKGQPSMWQTVLRVHYDEFVCMVINAVQLFLGIIMMGYVVTAM